MTEKTTRGARNKNRSRTIANGDGIARATRGENREHEVGVKEL